MVSAAYVIISSLVKKKKQKKNRRWWMTHLFKRRTLQMRRDLLVDLALEPITGQFQNFARMSVEDFEHLLSEVGPEIMKKDTVLRKAISTKERLLITLRFLATGDSYTSLQYLFKVSKQSISQIVPEVCLALIEALRECIKVSTETKLKLYSY